MSNLLPISGFTPFPNPPADSGQTLAEELDPRFIEELQGVMGQQAQPDVSTECSPPTEDQSLEATVSDQAVSLQNLPTLPWLAVAVPANFASSGEVTQSQADLVSQTGLQVETLVPSSTEELAHTGSSATQEALAPSGQELIPVAIGSVDAAADGLLSLKSDADTASTPPRGADAVAQANMQTTTDMPMPSRLPGQRQNDSLQSEQPFLMTPMATPDLTSVDAADGLQSVKELPAADTPVSPQPLESSSSIQPPVVGRAEAWDVSAAKVTASLKTRQVMDPGVLASVGPPADVTAAGMLQSRIIQEVTDLDEAAMPQEALWTQASNRERGEAAAQGVIPLSRSPQQPPDELAVPVTPETVKLVTAQRTGLADSPSVQPPPSMDMTSIGKSVADVPMTGLATMPERTPQVDSEGVKTISDLATPDRAPQPDQLGVETTATGQSAPTQAASVTDRSVVQSASDALSHTELSDPEKSSSSNVLAVGLASRDAGLHRADDASVGVKTEAPSLAFPLSSSMPGNTGQMDSPGAQDSARGQTHSADSTFASSFVQALMGQAPVVERQAQALDVVPAPAPMAPHHVRLDTGQVQVEVVRLVKQGGGQVVMELTPPDESKFKIDLSISQQGVARLVVDGASDSTRLRLEQTVNGLQEQFQQMGLQLQLDMREPRDQRNFSQTQGEPLTASPENTRTTPGVMETSVAQAPSGRPTWAQGQVYLVA